jgi:hypothetical protein
LTFMQRRQYRRELLREGLSDTRVSIFPAKLLSLTEVFHLQGDSP